jgi:hypothetical protein
VKTLPDFDQEREMYFSGKQCLGIVMGIIALSFVFLCIMFSCDRLTVPAHAAEVQWHTFSNDAIANAIYKAEGGTKTRHPYGILAHYKHTTPRQACINTIKHARRDWNGMGDFILFLQRRYCPIGAKNDPTGLNKNWERNVKRFLLCVQ